MIFAAHFNSHGGSRHYSHPAGSTSRTTQPHPNAPTGATTNQPRAADALGVGTAGRHTPTRGRKIIQSAASLRLPPDDREPIKPHAGRLGSSSVPRRLPSAARSCLYIIYNTLSALARSTGPASPQLLSSTRNTIRSFSTFKINWTLTRAPPPPLRTSSSARGFIRHPKNANPQFLRPERPKHTSPGHSAVGSPSPRRRVWDPPSGSFISSAVRPNRPPRPLASFCTLSSPRIDLVQSEVTEG